MDRDETERQERGPADSGSYEVCMSELKTGFNEPGVFLSSCAKSFIAVGAWRFCAGILGCLYLRHLPAQCGLLKSAPTFEPIPGRNETYCSNHPHHF